MEPIYHWPARLTAADIPLVSQVGAVVAPTPMKVFLTTKGQTFEYSDVQLLGLTLLQLFSELSWAGRPWGIVAEPVSTPPGELAGVTVFLRERQDLAYANVEVRGARPLAQGFVGARGQYLWHHNDVHVASRDPLAALADFYGLVCPLSVLP